MSEASAPARMWPVRQSCNEAGLDEAAVRDQQGSSTIWHARDNYRPQLQLPPTECRGRSVRGHQLQITGIEMVVFPERSVGELHLRRLPEPTAEIQDVVDSEPHRKCRLQRTRNMTGGNVRERTHACPDGSSQVDPGLGQVRAAPASSAPFRVQMSTYFERAHAPTDPSLLSYPDG